MFRSIALDSHDHGRPIQRHIGRREAPGRGIGSTTDGDSTIDNDHSCDAVPESSFRRYFMNQHAAIGESAWLPAGAWQRAATALVYVTEDDLRVGVETWTGEEAVIFAEAALREIAGTYSIVEVAFDPWRFGAQALDLSRAGMRMVEFPQSDSRMVPAGERLSAAILERRLRHPGDPVLDAHVAAAVAKQTQRGARIAHAGGRHSSNRGRESARAGEAARVALDAPPLYRLRVPDRGREPVLELPASPPSR